MSDLTPEDRDAREVITRVVGLMDRPWDTRAAVALFLVRHQSHDEDPPVEDVEAALTQLGYPLVECNPYEKG